MTDAAWSAAEQAARQSYGRLVAYLSARSRDVAAAEDALGEAFRLALDRWPEAGVPGRPEAWLLTVARREFGRRLRHGKVVEAARATLDLVLEAQSEAPDEAIDMVFPDERLKLLFICAHPAIDPAARPALMLQTVLGLDAARIASAFLVAPAALGQRLVRAKAKIRDARLAFAPPERSELGDRLEAVLEAIYAAYGAGWDNLGGSDPRRSGLAAEALYLGRTLVALLPDEPEAIGLLALMLHCEARAAARRGPDGGFVPLDRQDVRLWRDDLIAEGDAALVRAGTLQRFGRFQCEAAIQSVHAARRLTGRTDRAAVAMLYEALARIRPVLGVLVSRAAAVAADDRQVEALEMLDAIDIARTPDYQPYWAVRADVLARCDRPAEAGHAYDRAIGLAEDPSIRAFLIGRRASLGPC